MKEQLFNLIMATMEEVDKEKITGDAKKKLVLEIVNGILGDEDYNKYKLIIIETIEFIIKISKGLKIKINKKMCCLNI